MEKIRLFVLLIKSNQINEFMINLFDFYV